MYQRTVLCCLLMMTGCEPSADVADIAMERPPITVAGMRYSKPVGWIKQVPASSSRVAEYRLPADDPEEEAAHLVVYYFGRDGAGSVDANLDRWMAQFEQPEGADAGDDALVVEEDVNGLTVHRLDLSGTYIAETFPGSGQRVKESDYRLLAAIVETEAGPYYVKLVGPSRVVERWQESFGMFVNELEPAPPDAKTTAGEAVHP